MECRRAEPRSWWDVTGPEPLDTRIILKGDLKKKKQQVQQQGADFIPSSARIQKLFFNCLQTWEYSIT